MRRGFVDHFRAREAGKGRERTAGRRGEKKKEKRRVCEEAVMDSQSALAGLGVA